MAKAVPIHRPSTERPEDSLHGFSVLSWTSSVMTVVTTLADILRPLGAFFPFIFIGMAVTLCISAYVGFKLKHRVFRRIAIGLAFPLIVAGCCFAKLVESGTASGPPTGAIAATFPAVEKLQAFLPVDPTIKAELELESTLKGGTEAEKLVAIQNIDQLTTNMQRYLYKIALKYGTMEIKQQVLLALLTKHKGQYIIVDIPSSDSIKGFPRGIAGISIYIDFISSESDELKGNFHLGISSFYCYGQIYDGILSILGDVVLDGDQSKLGLKLALMPDLSLSGHLIVYGKGEFPATMHIY